MKLTRRMLLTTAVPAAGALALAGCTAAQIATYQAEWATVVGEIQSAVATAASYVPTVETIAEEAAALFGPQYEAIVAAGSAALNEIVAVLTNVVSNLTPPASAKLRARLRAAPLNTPVSIGTTPQGVVVSGFRV
jgi:hypothetical protein